MRLMRRIRLLKIKNIIILFLFLFLPVLLFLYKILDYTPYMLEFICFIANKLTIIFRPVFFGFIVSFLLYPFVFKFEKLNVDIYLKIFKKNKINSSVKNYFRVVSILATFVIVIVFIVSIFLITLGPFIRSINILSEDVYIFIEKFKISILDINFKLQDYGIDIDFFNLINQISSGDISKEINNIAENIFLNFSKIIKNVKSIIVNIIATFILSFYFLKDREIISTFLKNILKVLFTKDKDKIISEFFLQVGRVFYNFFSGEFLDSLLVGTVSTVLMIFIKHPFSFLIGFISGIMNIIPYFGPVFAIIATFILGSIYNFYLGIFGAIILFVYQQLDGNFIKPKIVGNKIGIPSVSIILSVVIGGGFYGIIGMMLAVPISAVIAIYYRKLLINKQINN